MYKRPNTHQPVTGIQSIDNKLYYFDASGVQQPATFGIDVSKYQSLSLIHISGVWYDT